MHVPAPWALGLIPVVGWASSPLPSEPLTLAELIRQSLEHNPDLAKAAALVEAEKERPAQARALPDPILGLGLQNDGFRSLMIGKMETSYYQVMLTQPLPWPGKRALRGDLARLEGERAQAGWARAKASVVADVKRAYLGLLLTLGQKALLERQELLWRKAEALTRTRYEVGQASQAEVLRAQVELARLRQTRLSLGAQERSFRLTLNRLRGEALDAPLAVEARLEEMPWNPATAAEWRARSEKESPELWESRVASEQAERRVALAQRERYPDFAVTAGVMPRGSFDPMWQVNVSITLPLWQKRKQAVSEQAWRHRETQSGIQSLQQQLALRIDERQAQMEATQETLRLYRDGLLVQSEATFQAALAQYESGRGGFLPVMEALNGWVADQSAYLQTLAQAHTLLIAQEEFNLAATPSIAAASLGSGAMGTGSVPMAASSSSSASRAASGPESGPAMPSM
ncbi:MAG: TolC family protein [Firmicutes bacterium]|nr:TolC family protein [Bacillota bacterium]